VIDGPAAFIAANTRVQSAPLTPELRFHLADEALPIWERTEEALERIGLPPPFWAFAWAGGQALARFVMDHARHVRGRRVLDIACGCPIAGIAAAKAGAGQVEASEIDPFAVEAARANAALNGVEIIAEEIDLIGQDRGWDVVLAGDVFYEGPGAERIRAWLRALHDRGALVLIGDPGRVFLPRDALEPLARYDTPVSRDLEDRDVRFARVWRFASE
jgi:predicted nicotinamide N-methyase